MRTPVALLLMSCVLLGACGVDEVVDPADPPVAGTTALYGLSVPQPDVDDAFNLVFVPDDDYGDMSVLANRQTFVSDVAEIIEQGFWQNEAFFNGLFRVNYFYLAASGDIVANPDDVDGNFVCPTLTWPDEASSEALFADSLILVHPMSLRDCAGIGPNSIRATGAEPTSFQTMVHENGHAIFGLPDEYCCDGAYFELPPVMYTSEDDCEADATNAAWRTCRSITSTRDGSVWWRSEGHYSSLEIMTQGCRPPDLTCQSDVWEFGPADWVIVSQAYQAIGANIGTGSHLPPTGDWIYDVPTPTPVP